MVAGLRVQGRALVAPRRERNSPGRLIIMAGLVFLARALPFCCRPSGRGSKQLLFGEDGGNGGLLPDWRGSANRGRG